MRMEREGLARQGNAIRPIGLVAVMDDYRRRTAGEPPRRVEPPADDRALPDVLGDKAPDFEPVGPADALWSASQHLGSAPSGRGEHQRQGNHRESEKTPNSIQRNRGSSQTATRNKQACGQRRLGR